MIYKDIPTIYVDVHMMLVDIPIILRSLISILQHEWATVYETSPQFVGYEQNSLIMLRS